MAEVLSTPASYVSGGLRRARPSQTNLMAQSSSSHSSSSSRKSEQRDKTDNHDKHDNNMGRLSSKHRSLSSPTLGSFGRSKSSDNLAFYQMTSKSREMASKREMRSPPPEKLREGKPLPRFPRFDPLPPNIDSDSDNDEDDRDAPPSSPEGDNTEGSSPGLTRPPRKMVPFQSEDDSAAVPQPSMRVDYLSHIWKEEDVWTSWRFVIRTPKMYDNRARLENASWRSWAKYKHNLKTTHPKKLNW
jgi:hypothetical protein